MTDKFFDDYFQKKPKGKKEEKLLDNLYKIPKKDKGVNAPRFQVPEAGVIQQADLLSMPEDQGYKYLLVVVDDSSRMTDAEPLKQKDAATVLQAFKDIYSRNVLSIPKRLEVDAGPEFKGVVAKYFQDKDVNVRVAAVARHRQEALVERKNQTIGTALHKRMTAEETITEQPSTEWVEDLPILIRALNKHTKETFKPFKPDLKSDVMPEATGESADVIPEGTRVRVALEAPQDFASGKRLHGKFRSSDLRWDETPRTVKSILIKPGAPPMYLLNDDGKGIDTVSYTRNQLQVIPKDEQYPDASVLRKEPTTYRVEKLVRKFKKSNRWYFSVKWIGYPSSQNTDEPRSELIKQVPNLVKEFESKED